MQNESEDGGEMWVKGEMTDAVNVMWQELTEGGGLKWIQGELVHWPRNTDLVKLMRSEPE